MLRTRLITALVVVAVLIPTVIFGRDHGIALLVAAFATIAMWEAVKSMPFLGTYGAAFCIAGAPLITAAFYFLPYNGLLAVPVFLPLVILTIHLIFYKVMENTLATSGRIMLMLAYAVIPLAHTILLSRVENGIAWVFYAIFVTALNDVGAYFMGRAFGRFHFIKHVSPGKTVEGLLGGALGSLLGMTIVKLAAYDMASWKFMLVLTAVCAVISPIGDLCASMMKRRLKIKDFGAILPGHGGALDRADSFIFVVPTVFYALIFSGWKPPL